VLDTNVLPLSLKGLQLCRVDGKEIMVSRPDCAWSSDAIPNLHSTYLT